MRVIDGCRVIGFRVIGTFSRALERVVLWVSFEGSYKLDMYGGFLTELRVCIVGFLGMQGWLHCICLVTRRS